MKRMAPIFKAMRSLRYVVLACLGITVLHAADTLPQRVEAFLQPRLQTAASGDARSDVAKTILARPDPGAFFLRYAFGLKQNAKKLLTPEQTAQLVAVLEKHTPANSRWHDERNTLRCKWTELMWLHAAASDTEAPKLRAELETWMRLRMMWTEQEHLAQYRFARDVWGVLTPEQQKKLLAGEWKDFAKQDTGHTRGDFTEKVTIRALGKPDDKAAFDAAIAAWSKQRAPLHAAVAEAENNERRIVFAMDLNSEPMANAANVKANAAFSALYAAEADATRRIVQAAYRDPSARCAKAAAEAWAEARKRFVGGAPDLIRFLASRP